MFDIIDLCKIVDNKYILNNINLKLPNVGLIIIKGENGSGKSTLLNLIGALDKPSTGSLIFNNKNLSNLSEKELSDYRENYVSFIFQDSNLFENSSVLDNITSFMNITVFINIIDYISNKVN